MVVNNILIYVLFLEFCIKELKAGYLPRKRLLRSLWWLLCCLQNTYV